MQGAEVLKLPVPATPVPCSSSTCWDRAPLLSLLLHSGVMLPTTLCCCQPSSPCLERPASHVALPFLPWKVKLCFPSSKRNTWRTGVFNRWLNVLCVLGASPLRESTQVGRAGVRSQGHLCVTATEARPPPGSATGLRESCWGSPLTTLVLPKSCGKALPLSWGLQQENPLSPVGR